ncbi:MAG: VOC family protein, partial [Bacteroidia bacterium]|nr:VOC family protein [Bacteroidia bacterium]
MKNNSPIVIGYRHTGIIVKDMEESLCFYKDILGLKVIQDFHDDSDYINKITGIMNADVHMIKLKAEDGTVLEILEYRNHPTGLVDQPIYNAGASHIAFQVNNADKAY